MTTEQLQAVFNLYLQRLSYLGVDNREDGLPLQHAVWMCLTMSGKLQPIAGIPEWVPDLGDKALVEKAHRWLGFVQGVLYMEHVYTIGQLRDHNRSQETL